MHQDPAGLPDWPVGTQGCCWEGTLRLLPWLRRCAFAEILWGSSVVAFRAPKELMCAVYIQLKRRCASLSSEIQGCSISPCKAMHGMSRSHTQPLLKKPVVPGVVYVQGVSGIRTHAAYAQQVPSHPASPAIAASPAGLDTPVLLDPSRSRTVTLLISAQQAQVRFLYF